MRYGYTANDSITLEEINGLVGYEEKSSPVGNYTITLLTNGYVWICIDPSEEIHSIKDENGFEFKYILHSVVGKYKCYRSQNELVPYTWKLTII